MKKIIESQIFVLSKTNKVSVPIQICYTNDDVEITVSYNDTEYCAKGKDHLWVDAFADLQAKLPSNTQLACCMTCRHGNMCPYGNRENQLFCTKDLVISSKEDMVDLFNNTDPFSERIVSAIKYCEGFIYQSSQSYTYNDFLYYLEKKP